MDLHHIQKFMAFKHGRRPIIVAIRIEVRKLWLKPFKNSYMKDLIENIGCRRYIAKCQLYC